MVNLFNLTYDNALLNGALMEIMKNITVLAVYGFFIIIAFYFLYITLIKKWQ